MLSSKLELPRLRITYGEEIFARLELQQTYKPTNTGSEIPRRSSIDRALGTTLMTKIIDILR